MDNNITAAPGQLSLQQTQEVPATQTVQTDQQTQALQTALQAEMLQTDAVQTEAAQAEEQRVAAELAQMEQQTAALQAAAAAPAPPVQQQRQRRTLREKLADRRRRKAEERRQREEQRQREREEREAQAAREAEERRQQEEEERRQQEAEARAEAWRREQEQRMEDMDDRIRVQGKVKEARVRDMLAESTRAALDSLTKEERDALAAYTKEGRQEGDISYHSMNQILRDGTYQEGGGLEGGDLPAVRQRANFEQVTHVIHALEKSKLAEDLVVRRGADLSTLLHLLNLMPAELGEQSELEILNQNYRSFNDGNFVCCDRGFLSTSPYQNGGFWAGGISRSLGVEFIIQAHRGDEALLIENLSESRNEAEMLFQAGTRYRIIKICGLGQRKLEKGDGFKVYMETIPEVEPLRGRKEQNVPQDPPDPPQE